VGYLALRLLSRRGGPSRASSFGFTVPGRISLCEDREERPYHGQSVLQTAVDCAKQINTFCCRNPASGNRSLGRLLRGVDPGTGSQGLRRRHVAKEPPLGAGFDRSSGKRAAPPPPARPPQNLKGGPSRMPISTARLTNASDQDKLVMRNNTAPLAERTANGINRCPQLRAGQYSQHL